MHPSGPCPQCGGVVFIEEVESWVFDEPGPADVTEHYELRCRSCDHVVEAWPVWWLIKDAPYSRPEPEIRYYGNRKEPEPEIKQEYLPPKSWFPQLTSLPSTASAARRGWYHSCFISYSTSDRDFAERLRNDLIAKGVRVWFAPHDLKIGDRFQETVEESISRCDKVIIVLSTASVASRWVEREVNAAREREDLETLLILLPIRIDNAVMDASAPWAADIRRLRHIGDFTKWEEPTHYEKAISRLLQDLRNR